MTDRAQTIIIIITIAMSSFVGGWFLGLWLAGFSTRHRQRLSGPPRANYGSPRQPQPEDWRRSFNHENTNAPSGPPPFRLRRSGDAGAVRPSTPKPDIIPKPQFPPPRSIRDDLLI